ncbi:MAG: hypothetical protein AB7T49_18020 [Oligoflexales bacterium]
MLRHTAITAFLIGLLSACANTSSDTVTGPSKGSKDGKDSIAGDSLDAFTAGLIGIWATACQPIPNNDTAWVRYEFRYNEKQFINRTLTYKEKECTSIYRDVIVHHTYVVGDSVDHSPVPNTHEINWVFLKTELAIYQDALIATYNQNNGYGYSDWQPGIYKEVGGRAYTPDTAVIPHEPGKVVYSIIAYDEQFLVDGDFTTGDGDSPLTRPRDVRTKFPFFRKNNPLQNGYN